MMAQIPYKDDDAKKWLGSSARSDVEHDVDYLTSQFVFLTILNAFRAGIPLVDGQPTEKHTGEEWGVLDTVLNGWYDPNGNLVLKNGITFKQIMQNQGGPGIPDVTNAERAPLRLKIGIPDSGPLRDYTAVCFRIEAKSSRLLIPIHDDPVNPENIGINFCDRTKI